MIGFAARTKFPTQPSLNTKNTNDKKKPGTSVRWRDSGFSPRGRRTEGGPTPPEGTFASRTCEAGPLCPHLTQSPGVAFPGQGVTCWLCSRGRPRSRDRSSRLPATLSVVGQEALPRRATRVALSLSAACGLQAGAADEHAGLSMTRREVVGTVATRGTATTRLQVTRAEQANCVKPKRHCARDASPSCLFKDIAPEALPAASGPQARPSPRRPSLKPPALPLLLPTSEGASSHVLPQRPRRALLGASRSRLCCRPQLSSSRFLLSQTQPDFGAHRSATNGRVGRIDSDVRVDPPSGQFPALVSVGLSAALVTATALLFGKLDALDGTLGRFPSFVWFTLVCFLSHPSPRPLSVEGRRARFLAVFPCLFFFGFTRSYGFRFHLYTNGFSLHISSLASSLKLKTRILSCLLDTPARAPHQTGQTRLRVANDDLESGWPVAVSRRCSACPEPPSLQDSA